MSSGSLARRYAKALMEIGLADNSYQRIGKDVETMANAIATSAELNDLFSNPVFPRSEREKIVLAILKRAGASVSVTNFSKLLLDRDRMGILPDISRELNAMIDAQSGQVTAQITSAAPLNAMQQNELRLTLEQVSGKKVQLEVKEDATLLGGLIAKVGDLVYDGSLRTQLREIRRNISE